MTNTTMNPIDTGAVVMLDTTKDDGRLTVGATSFDDFYYTVLFCTSLYIAGDVLCSKILKIIPPLVGHIAVGIVFGPEVLDLLPSLSSFVTIGNLGLVLLICQAGLDTDLDLLCTVGLRGVLMAIVGSGIPIAIGILFLHFVFGQGVEASIAAGCAFGPSSAGIAISMLGQCGILKKDVGQLVVAIVVVDDMVALVILSQLRALTDDVSVASILIPIISALLWIFLGGFIALWWMPTLFQALFPFINQFHEKVTKTWCLQRRYVGPLIGPSNSTTVLMGAVNVLLLILLPSAYYTDASYLLGAFLAGLSCCFDSDVARQYRHQFKRVTRWLMRIFFGASIGFQIPVTLFNDGTVVWQGMVMSMALLGKVATGLLLTPVLQPGGERFQGTHLRDCIVVGLSMAAEAEFAFVIAVYGMTERIVSTDTYASVVFAILMSTVLSPVLLRTVLALSPYEHEPEDDGKDEDEESTIDVIESSLPNVIPDSPLVRSLLALHPDRRYSNGSLVTLTKLDIEPMLHELTIWPRFWLIQIKSTSLLGGLPWLLRAMAKLQLEVLDHRTWKERDVSDDELNAVMWMRYEMIAIDNLQELVKSLDYTEPTNWDEKSRLRIRMAQIYSMLCDGMNRSKTEVALSEWIPPVTQNLDGLPSLSGSQSLLVIMSTMLSEARDELSIRAAERIGHGSERRDSFHPYVIREEDEMSE